MRDGCAAELDGGRLSGEPSTVIDFTGEEPVVLREGRVQQIGTPEELHSRPVNWQTKV